MKLGLRSFLALATAAYLFSVSGKFFLPAYQSYSDIGYVYDYFVLPTRNGVPYHAYAASATPGGGFVYPAIPAILVWLSGFGVPTRGFYLARMALFTFPFVVIAVYFLYQICVEFGFDRRRIVPFFVLAPSFLVMSFYSWDIIAASLVIAAAYYALKKNSRLTGLCLGLGFAAKSYPLLLLPVFLKEAQTWRGRFVVLLSTVVGGLIPNLPFMLIDFNGWFHTIAAPAGRGGLYVENSIWTVIQYYHLIGQGWLMSLAAWSIIAVAILCVTFSRASFVLKLWLVVAVTILVFPTYPPQFDIWLLPLFALIPIFPYVPFLAFDLLDTAVLLVWFSVPIPGYIPAWGPVWDIFLARLGLLAVLLVWALHRRSEPMTVSHNSNRLGGTGPPPAVA